MNADTATPAPAAPDAVLRLARGFRMQWEPAQDAHVLLYPEGMVTLNGSAAHILKRCDGERSVQAIASELEDVFEQSGLLPEVRSFAGIALAQGWLETVS